MKAIALDHSPNGRLAKYTDKLLRRRVRQRVCIFSPNPTLSVVRMIENRLENMIEVKG